MRKLHKILLFSISFVGLLFSVAMLSFFYEIPVVSDAVRLAYNFYPYLHDVLAIYLMLVAVCFLLLILAVIFAPKASGYLILTKNGGRLQFSKQTVESTVRYSFADVEGVNLSAVKAVLGRTPEKTRIFVKLSLTDPNRLVELTETVKNKIEASLQTSLGVTAKSINIQVIELAHGKEPKAGIISAPVPAPTIEPAVEARPEAEEPAASSRVI